MRQLQASTLRAVFGAHSALEGVEMKRLFALLASLIAVPALAATYTYSGGDFVGIVNNTTCTVGNCPATYTTSMHVTGSFTTAAPLPPNLLNSNIAGLITAYSFNDGINTIVSSGPNTRIEEFSVTTDSTGALIPNWAITVEQWTTDNPGPHVATDRFNYILSESSIPVDFAVNDMGCGSVGTGPSGVGDSCLSINTDSNTSAASVSAIGTFSSPPQAIAMPTLSARGVMILSALVMLFGLVRARRNRGV